MKMILCDTINKIVNHNHDDDRDDGVDGNDLVTGKTRSTTRLYQVVWLLFGRWVWTESVLWRVYDDANMVRRTMSACTCALTRTHKCTLTLISLSSPPSHVHAHERKHAHEHERTEICARALATKHTQDKSIRDTFPRQYNNIRDRRMGTKWEGTEQHYRQHTYRNIHSNGADSQHSIRYQSFTENLSAIHPFNHSRCG